MVSRVSPSTVRSRLSEAALEEFNWSARGLPPSRSTRFEGKQFHPEDPSSTIHKNETIPKVCCTGTTGRAHIQLQRLQFINKYVLLQSHYKSIPPFSCCILVIQTLVHRCGFVRSSENEEETMQSSAAHVYVISAASVTVR